MTVTGCIVLNGVPASLTIDQVGGTASNSLITDNGGAFATVLAAWKTATGVTDATPYLRYTVNMGSSRVASSDFASSVAPYVTRMAGGKLSVGGGLDNAVSQYAANVTGPACAYGWWDGNAFHQNCVGMDSNGTPFLAFDAKPGTTTTFTTSTTAGSILMWDGAGGFYFKTIGASQTNVGATVTAGIDASGNVNAVGGYKVNGTAGVSCSGAPTASFAVTNGIVTHC